LENNIDSKISITEECVWWCSFEKHCSYKEDPKKGSNLDWFYGDSLDIYSSFGGWIPFGPERVITKEAYILYEIDGQPALDLKYLEKSRMNCRKHHFCTHWMLPDGKKGACGADYFEY
jgi:hypothetical protein